MNTGDLVVCRGSRGYHLTTGNRYTVVEYQPEVRDPTFTWPAYVMVKDNYGDPVWCHAHRFTTGAEE